VVASRCVVLALGAGIAAFGATGCGKSAERLERERVAASVDRLRDAPAAQRVERLNDLEKETASDPLAKRARATCINAYRSLQQAQTDIVGMQTSLATAKRDGNAIDPTLVAKLLAAEETLNAAEQGRAECAAAAAELHRSLR
jgi:hypothetical protein